MSGFFAFVVVVVAIVAWSPLGRMIGETLRARYGQPMQATESTKALEERFSALEREFAQMRDAIVWDSTENHCSPGSGRIPTGKLREPS